jgi:hypothetical protein
MSDAAQLLAAAEGHLQALDAALADPAARQALGHGGIVVVRRLRDDLGRAGDHCKQVLEAAPPFEDRLRAEIELRWLCNQAAYWLKHLTLAGELDMAARARGNEPMTLFEYFRLWCLFRCSYFLGRVLRLPYADVVGPGEFYPLLRVHWAGMFPRTRQRLRQARGGLGRFLGRYRLVRHIYGWVQRRRGRS